LDSTRLRYSLPKDGRVDVVRAFINKICGTLPDEAARPRYDLVHQRRLTSTPGHVTAVKSDRVIQSARRGKCKIVPRVEKFVDDSTVVSEDGAVTVLTDVGAVIFCTDYRSLPLGNSTALRGAGRGPGRRPGNPPASA